MFKNKKEKLANSEINAFVLGSPGSGKCHEPWNDLKPCHCGCKERPLLMYEKDKSYVCGGSTKNVFAICSVCGRHTEKSDISTTINKWNDNKTIDVSEMEFYVMSRKEFLLNKMQEAQAFDLSKEEVSLYFQRISLYIKANNYSAFRHMKEKHPIEPLSERQEICSQNAINCLFKKEYVQALHETLDVLSDNNKETPLNYNECVVLQNILTTYNQLK